MNILLTLYKLAQVLLKYEPLAERLVVLLEQLFHDLEQHPPGEAKIQIVPNVAPIRTAHVPTPTKVEAPKLPSEKPEAGSSLEADLKRLDELSKG